MRLKNSFFVTSVSILALSLTLQSSLAQDASESVVLDPITIKADRLASSPESMTRNVTVLNKDEIEKLQASSRDLTDLLGKAVPGFGLSTGAFTTFGQGLRGRSAL